MKQITNVIYSYFDDKSGKRIQSSTGVDIEGTVTPARVKATVVSKWKKAGYFADKESIEIEQEEKVFGHA